MRILPGSAATQTELYGLSIYHPLANYL